MNEAALLEFLERLVTRVVVLEYEIQKLKNEQDNAELLDDVLLRGKAFKKTLNELKTPEGK